MAYAISIRSDNDSSREIRSQVTARRKQFNVIMLTAVWMHLEPHERQAGMPILSALLAKNGTLFMSLRHGPVPEGRRIFEVPGEHAIELASSCGLRPVLNIKTQSSQAINRAAGVTWTRLAFRECG